MNDELTRFHHWLHRKSSKWQLPVHPATNISSKWYFRFSIASQTAMIGHKFWNQAAAMWLCLFDNHIDGLEETAVSQVHYQWRYCSLALSHRYHASNSYDVNELKLQLSQMSSLYWIGAQVFGERWSSDRPTDITSPKAPGSIAADFNDTPHDN